MSDDFRKKTEGLHIGIIPDGNRRYAQKKKLPVANGHIIGSEKIKDFTKWCLDYPEVKQITIFALSTENLRRTEEEIEQLWKVYKEKFNEILIDPVIRDHNVKVRILGNDGVWKPNIRELARNVVNSTKNYSKHIVNIMLAYGSKFEIADAVRKMANKPLGTLEKFLLVKEPLDLVIRTGGQYRLSNFMLYQASYAEIYFSKTLWPEFSRKEFDKIMDWYYEQVRKWGR